MALCGQLGLHAGACCRSLLTPAALLPSACFPCFERRDDSQATEENLSDLQGQFSLMDHRPGALPPACCAEGGVLPLPATCMHGFALLGVRWVLPPVLAGQPAGFWLASRSSPPTVPAIADPLPPTKPTYPPTLSGLQ